MSLAKQQLLFSPGDVMTFPVSDDRYGAVVCVQITEEKRSHVYNLVATTFMNVKPPTMEDILLSDMAGVKIETNVDAGVILSRQPGVDKIWKHAGMQNFFFGCAYMLVSFKDMSTYKDAFNVIGKLEINTSFIKVGGYSYFSTFEKFERVFLDLDAHMNIFRQIKVPVSILRA